MSSASYLFLLSTVLLTTTNWQNIITSATTVSTCQLLDSLDNVTLPEVDIDGCITPPCAIYIGENASMLVRFRAPRYLDKIAPQVLAQVMGLTVPFPLAQADACEGIVNTPCPLAENELVEYQFVMLIYTWIPETSLSLEFSLVDKEDDANPKPFVCFRADLETHKRI